MNSPNVPMNSPNVTMNSPNVTMNIPNVPMNSAKVHTYGQRVHPSCLIWPKYRRMSEQNRPKAKKRKLSNLKFPRIVEMKSSRLKSWRPQAEGQKFRPKFWRENKWPNTQKAGVKRKIFLGKNFCQNFGLLFCNFITAIAESWDKQLASKHERKVRIILSSST